MKPSMMFCLTLPFAFAACVADPPGDGTTDEETGITTLTTDGDGDGDPGDGDPGDGDGDPGDGDPSGDGDGDPMDCGEVFIQPTYIPPSVMLVVDASGSMVFEPNNWDHDLDMVTPEVTRWFSLHGVVDTVLANYGPQMHAGLQRFPSASACNPYPCYNATSCTVENSPEVDIAYDNGPEILAALPGPDATNMQIKGGTPATKGIVSAVNHLMTQDPLLPRYILLITDGAANCNTDLPFPDFIEFYDELLPTTVEQAFTDGITTFVVGIDIINMLVGSGNDGAPEANPYERLNDVAVAGGAPKNMGQDAEKFFNATNQDELLGAIEEILGTVTECTIDLTMQEGGPPDPIQIPYVQFFVGDPPVEVPKVTDCATEDGWTWIDEGLIVTFCGSYCEDFKSGTSVDGTYGCPPAG